MHVLVTVRKLLAVGSLTCLTATVATAQFDEIQNYGDGRTDGGGPGTWSPLSPNGATITAGGGDFWGGSDNASFVTSSDGSLTTTSDFTATARHISTPDASTNAWGREPIMMRAQAATGAVLDPANPANTNANSAHYMAFRRSASDVSAGWRHAGGGGTNDWARSGGPGFQPTGNIRDTPHFLGIGRSGGDLYAGHAADVSFGVGAPTPGRWIELHNTTTGTAHPGIGAGTEVTVGVGHQSHNAIPGGGGGANTTSWDSFALNDGAFDPSLFGPAPAGDYTVFGGLTLVDDFGKVFGSAGTFENGAATGEPTGWKVTAVKFDLVEGANANGSTVIPDVWWTGPGNGPANGYPNDIAGTDDHGGANNTNLFAEAVQAGPGGAFEANQDSYGVDMQAEIFIPSDADRGGREWVAFKDGIDDFTYLQIDGQDLINDNSWTGIESNQNQGGFVSRLDTSDPKYDDGEWVSFRMIMWEGGGGDTAALYWDTDGTSTFNFDAGNTPLTGLANGANSNTAVGDRTADLVPAANFRQPGTTDPGIQADIYLAGNPGNLPAILNIVAPGRVVTESYVVTGTSPVGQVPSSTPVWLAGDVDVHKLNGAAGADPDGNEGAAPSRFSGPTGNDGIRALIQAAIDGGDPELNSNTHPDTLIQEPETPNPAQVDDYRLAVRGTFVVDNSNGIPGETLDLTFTIRNDDGGQLQIIGQSFTGVAGDGRTFLEDIGGDAALTADFFTGNTNALGHISLVEGTYDFDSYMFEGGGGSRFELQAALGTKSAHDGDFFVIDTTVPAEGLPGEFPGVSIPEGYWDEVSLMVANTGSAVNPTVLTDLHIDFTPPVINCGTDIVRNVPVGGSAMVSFAHITAVDNLDGPVPHTCSPDDSAPFPVGITEITCEATDAKGNIGTATFNVIVIEFQATPGVRSLTDVSLRGDSPPGPGTGTVGGLPAGAALHSYKNAYLNNAGQLVFQANLSSAGANNFALLTDAGGALETIGVKNSASPTGATYLYFTDVAIGDDGVSSFGARTDAGDSQVTDSGGSTTLQAGSPPPGLAGAPLVKSISEAALDGVGDLYSQAGLTLGSGGGVGPDGVTLFDFELPDGTTDLGLGTALVGNGNFQPSVQGGRLQITANTNSNNSAFHIPLPAHASKGFEVTFDYELSDPAGGNPPADGFSVSYGALPFGALSGQAEEGFPGVSPVLSWEMDTWMVGDTEVGPAIAVDNANIPGGFTNGDIFRDGETISGTVTITLDAAGTTSFTSTGAVTNAAFIGLPTGFVLDDNHTLAITARTGGANEDLFIDNLRIVCPGQPIPPVGVTSDTLIWSAISGLVAREGDQAAGLAPGIEHGHLFNRVVATDGPAIAFAGNLTGPGASNAAVWAGDPNAPSVVARKGDTAPGTGGEQFGSFNAESISPSGSIVFRAGLKLAPMSVDTSNNEALFTNRGGSLALVAREGSEAPCGPAGVQFGRFDSLFIDSDSSIVFVSYLKGESVDSANDKSVWRSAADGSLSLLAREGAAANNVEGGVFGQITMIAANNTGGVFVQAGLVPGIGDVTVANRYGIWRARNAGELVPELVLRRGDTLNLAGTDHVIVGIDTSYVTNAAGGTGGFGRVMNDGGEAVLSLTLSGNLSGLFTLP